MQRLLLANRLWCLIPSSCLPFACPVVVLRNAVAVVASTSRFSDRPWERSFCLVRWCSRYLRSTTRRRRRRRKMAAVGSVLSRRRLHRAFRLSVCQSVSVRPVQFHQAWPVRSGMADSRRHGGGERSGKRDLHCLLWTRLISGPISVFIACAP